jgi:hypothetical protein
MTTEFLYHGTTGANILSIIESGEIKPNHEHKIFFARFYWEHVLMHGGDRHLRATFAIKVMATIPDGVVQERVGTAGVFDTLVLLTHKPIHVSVLELFVREPHATKVTHIVGDVAIRHYLINRGKEQGKK